MTLGDRRISASLVSVEFLPTDHGTDLICTHQGAFFEGADGPQRREEGWRQLLERLANELCAESNHARGKVAADRDQVRECVVRTGAAHPPRASAPSDGLSGSRGRARLEVPRPNHGLTPVVTSIPSASVTETVRAMPSPKVNIDRVFHALGDPTRRAIVEKLSEGPLSVSRLATPLEITLTAVIQHLQVLEESGLVHTEKLGRVRTCRLETAGFSVLEQWIRDRRSMWERRLDRLGDLLAESDEDESSLPP